MSRLASQHHLVNGVVWNNTLDSADEVRHLQDWFSVFSHDILPELLIHVFEDCCPAEQTWRCEQLELNLGRIRIAHIQEDLPRRLTDSLKEALLQQFLLPKQNAFSSVNKPSKTEPHVKNQILPNTIKPRHSSSLAIFEHLLLHGSLPWWQKQSPNIISLWETLYAIKPKALAKKLIQLGHHESVRERLVWQLGVVRMPDLLHLLHPTYADALIEWVHELSVGHTNEHLVQDNANAFEHSVWLTLLTCLLAERGNVSNTTEFTRIHLRKLAQRYGIAYEVMLTRLQQSCERRASYLPRRFRYLLNAVIVRDLKPPLVPIVKSIDIWARFPIMLARGETKLSATEGGYTLQQLFLHLAQQDEARTARLLLKTGDIASHVLSIHFDESALRRVITLLQPSESAFICTHVTHSQHMARRKHWSRRSIWQIVLAFLLAKTLSRFERKQLVEHTLKHWCQQHNTAYHEALAYLILDAQSSVPSPHHYALLHILLELQQATQRHHLITRQAKPLVQHLSRYKNEVIDLKHTAITPAKTEAIDNIPMNTLWRALCWRLRAERAAPWMPSPIAALSLTELWQKLPFAKLRKWLMQQPDRARLLPQLATIPKAQRWLERLVPAHLRPLSELLEQAIHWLHHTRLYQDTSDLQLSHKLAPHLWRLALDPLAMRITRVDFLAHCMLQWCHLLQISVSTWAEYGQDNSPSSTWQAACQQLHQWVNGAPVVDAVASQISSRYPAQKPLKNDNIRRITPDAWGKWLEQPEAERYLLQYLCQKNCTALHRRYGVAGWPYSGGTEQRLATAVYHFAWKRPQALRRLLKHAWKRTGLRPQLSARLRAALPLPHLLDLVKRSYTKQAELITLLTSWQQWQQHMPLPHRSIREEWLWHIIWQAWLYEDWPSLEAKKIIFAFCHYFLPFSGMNAATLNQCLRATATYQPKVLADALLDLFKQDGEINHNALSEENDLNAISSHAYFYATQHQQRFVLIPSDQIRHISRGHPFNSTSKYSEPIYSAQEIMPPSANQRLLISNAGLVLVQSFLPMLFKRLNLTNDNHFIDTKAMQRAIVCLQFLACGQSAADEPHLVLNKVLCGLTPHAPAPISIKLTSIETEAIDGLLQALCSHWSEGSTSSNALRGNWLLRPGVLSDAGDHWSLTIERRAWDVLLARCPFSYAVIKLPCMTKALYVTWPS